MNLLAKPSGYTNPEDVYMSPAQIKQPVKNKHSKQDETLLELTMKSFLKQRLYGNFQNFDRINSTNKNHLSARRDQQYKKDSIRYSTARKQKQYFEPELSQRNSLNLQKKRKYSVLGNLSGSKNESTFQKLDFLKKRQLNKSMNLSSQDIEEIYPINSGRYSKQQKLERKPYHPRNRSSIDVNDPNIVNNSKISSVLSNYKVQEIKNGKNENLAKGPSFISAVQFDQKSSIQRTDQYSTVNLKLPKLNKNNLKKEEFVKNAKMLFKKQLEPKSIFNDQVWDNLLCQKAKIKPKDVLSKNTSHFDNYDELNTPTSKNLRKRSTDKSDKNSLQKIKKSIETNQKKSQNLLIKENLISLVKNEKFVIPKLAQSIFHFFQIPSKFQDKMRKYEVEKVFQKMYNTSDRAWAVAIFTFLDQNKDSEIDSSDIFNFHNYLDQLQQKVKNEQKRLRDQLAKEKDLMQLQYEVEPSNILCVRKKTQNKRQKTDASIVSKDSYRRADKTNLRNVALKQVEKDVLKTGESQQDSNEQMLVSQIKMVNANLTNIQRAKQFAERLNDIILSMTSHSQRDKRLGISGPPDNGVGQNHSGSNRIQLTYLEEALLQKQDLKVSDLALLLHEQQKSSSVHKKKVIELDPVKLSIKLASSYIQTFTATDHNEETRNNRQYIETLKDFLKQQQNKRHSQKSDLETQSLLRLGYVNFFKAGLFMPIKEIFYSLFHIEIQHETK